MTGKTVSSTIRRILGLGLLLTIGLTSKNLADKENQYNLIVNQKCQQVLEKYDENENDIIDIDEGTKLARDLGYNERFPTGELLISLKPGNHFQKNIVYNARTRETRNGGLFPSNIPTWEKNISVPLSRLEEISKD